MSLYSKVLDKAKSYNKLVAVRTTNREETILIGQVISYNEAVLMLNVFTPKGHFDGQFIIEFGNINAIEYDDTYLRKVQYWIDHQAQIFEPNPAPLFLNKSLEDFESVLKMAKKGKKLIEFRLDFDLKGFGYIMEADEDHFMIRQYNIYGEYEGLGVYSIYDLEGIKWDTPELRTIELMLHETQSVGNGRSDINN